MEAAVTWTTALQTTATVAAALAAIMAWRTVAGDRRRRIVADLQHIHDLLTEYRSACAMSPMVLGVTPMTLRLTISGAIAGYARELPACEALVHSHPPASALRENAHMTAIDTAIESVTDRLAVYRTRGLDRLGAARRRGSIFGPGWRG